MTEINARDKLGSTSLSVAVSKGCVPVAEILINRSNCDVNAPRVRKPNYPELLRFFGDRFRFLRANYSFSEC